MKRLLFFIVLGIISCQPCPAQEFPEYWKLPFGYIGSYGSVNFPQGRMWMVKDTLPEVNLWRYGIDTNQITPNVVKNPTPGMTDGFWIYNSYLQLTPKGN